MSEVERKYPKVRITGGPSPKDLVVQIDDQKVAKVFGAELSMGVNQAVALTLHLYIEADIEVEGLAINDFMVVVRSPAVTSDGAIREWTEMARGIGPTIPAALRDAAQKLEPVS